MSHHIRLLLLRAMVLLEHQGTIQLMLNKAVMAHLCDYV